MSKPKQIILWVLTFFPLFYFFAFGEKWEQDPSFHNFADSHDMMGLFNFHNVTSNLPFCIVAYLGIKDYFNDKANYTISWLAFFVGVFLVGPGSAYYHYNPNNDTLVWDRIPMTIAFMGITSAAFCNLYKIKEEAKVLFPLIALGIGSVILWHFTNDLRVYAWVQITPILTMFYIAFAYPTEKLKPKYLVGAILFYVLAKTTEKYDQQIFDMIHYSGHSIKHLLASITVLILVRMNKRQAS